MPVACVSTEKKSFSVQFLKIFSGRGKKNLKNVFLLIFTFSVVTFSLDLEVKYFQIGFMLKIPNIYDVNL